MESASAASEVDWPSTSTRRSWNVRRVGYGLLRVRTAFRPAGPIEVGDASPQNATEPGADAHRVFERLGALRGSYHRSLHDVLCVCLGRKLSPSQAQEP
jgi:hypothetical protein